MTLAASLSSGAAAYSQTTEGLIEPWGGGGGGGEQEPEDGESGVRSWSPQAHIMTNQPSAMRVYEEGDQALRSVRPCMTVSFLPLLAETGLQVFAPEGPVRPCRKHIYVRTTSSETPSDRCLEV